MWELLPCPDLTKGMGLGEANWREVMLVTHAALLRVLLRWPCCLQQIFFSSSQVKWRGKHLKSKAEIRAQVFKTFLWWTVSFINRKPNRNSSNWVLSLWLLTFPSTLSLGGQVAKVIQSCHLGAGKTGGDWRWEYFWHWGCGGDEKQPGGTREGPQMILQISGYRFFSAHQFWIFNGESFLIRHKPKTSCSKPPTRI